MTQEEWNKFISSQENKKAAEKLATKYAMMTGGDWFFLDDILNKSDLERKTAAEQIFCMHAFGYLDSKKMINGTKYKVNFDLSRHEK